MENSLERTKLLIGESGVEKLKNSRVAVFGIGGVGGYAVEALARSGVGAIDLIDNDVVAVSNLNRQIIATNETIGKFKTEAMAVTEHRLFILETPHNMLDFTKFDYVIDAIDTVTGKLGIIESAKRFGVPVISCMGAGNKLDPTAFEVADISETSVCPLAKVMRRELKKRGISGVKVVYSKEEPCIKDGGKDGDIQKKVPASIAFVPSVAGLIAAGEVIKDLCGINGVD